MRQALDGFLSSTYVGPAVSQGRAEREREAGENFFQAPCVPEQNVRCVSSYWSGSTFDAGGLAVVGTLPHRILTCSVWEAPLLLRVAACLAGGIIHRRRRWRESGGEREAGSN